MSKPTLNLPPLKQIYRRLPAGRVGLQMPDAPANASERAVPAAGVPKTVRIQFDHWQPALTNSGRGRQAVFRLLDDMVDPGMDGGLRKAGSSVALETIVRLGYSAIEVECSSPISDCGLQDAEFVKTSPALANMVQERDWDRAKILAEHLCNWVHQRRLDASAKDNGVHHGGP